jgi:hypothetical protein
MLAKPALDAACRSAERAGDLDSARRALAILEAAALDTGHEGLPVYARKAVAALEDKAGAGAGWRASHRKAINRKALILPPSC